MRPQLQLIPSVSCLLSMFLLVGCPSGGEGSNSTDAATNQEVSSDSVTDAEPTSDAPSDGDTTPASDEGQVEDIAGTDGGPIVDAGSDTFTPEDTVAPKDTATPEDTSVTDTPPTPDTALPVECADATPKENIEVQGGKTTLSFVYSNQGVPSERELVIQAPNELGQKKLPVLFFFHGSGGGTNGIVNQCKKVQQSGIELLCVAVQGGPQAEGGAPGWNLGEGQTAEDDLTFVRTIWNAMKDDPHVDSNNVYAAGSSMGGAFTANVLSVSACTNFLSGHAHVASTMFDDTVIESKGQQSVVIIHGEDDGLIPIDGGLAFGTLNFLSVEEALAVWATHNGCDMEGAPLVEDEAKITRISYPSCDVPMVVYRLKNKGHNADVTDWYGANNVALLYEVFVNKNVP
jgi:poly(3-hydroxybutyrate) depolymerase